MVVDIVASVAILAFAFVLGLVTLSFVTQLSGLGAVCGAGPYTGLECNSTVLGIATYGLLAVTVLAFVIGLGMAIVRIIQKRFTFFWPLGALILMIAAFYFFTWLASQTVPAA